METEPFTGPRGTDEWRLVRTRLPCPHTFSRMILLYPPTHYTVLLTLFCYSNDPSKSSEYVPNTTCHTFLPYSQGIQRYISGGKHLNGHEY